LVVGNHSPWKFARTDSIFLSSFSAADEYISVDFENSSLFPPSEIHQILKIKNVTVFWSNTSRPSPRRALHPKH